MVDFGKVNEIMCWDAYEGETPEQVFIRKSNKIDDLPCAEVIDIVYAGGLKKWADNMSVSNQSELYSRIIKAMRRTISDPAFQSVERLKNFPPLSNFFFYCQKIDRNGNMDNEAKAISELAWNGVICRRNIDERTKGMFSNPNKEEYKKAAKRIKEVYKYTDKDIDALRYFVCQTRHEDHNPSMNKCIYHWGDDKQTGKTTVAKTIVSILNGDTLEHSGMYLSTLSRELQYNKHDIPKAALFNAVILDEAMPKDSRKSYGAVKSMLTNNSCDFDPKFKQVITVPCRRYYYFTSNDDISEFIQDYKERRIIPIHSTEKPEQISFDEIYKIWYNFCVNCEPEDNWQKWYNSFEMVEGIASKDLAEVKNEILVNGFEIFSGEKYNISPKIVANKLFKNEPTRDQKKTVADAMEEMFPNARMPSNRYLYKISDCKDVLIKLVGTNSNSEKDVDLPF